MLFGAGFAIHLVRLAARGEEGLRLYRRRVLPPFNLPRSFVVEREPRFRLPIGIAIFAAFRNPNIDAACAAEPQIKTYR